MSSGQAAHPEQLLEVQPELCSGQQGSARVGTALSCISHLLPLPGSCLALALSHQGLEGVSCPSPSSSLREPHRLLALWSLLPSLLLLLQMECKE